jgi:hypothetical protein
MNAGARTELQSHIESNGDEALSRAFGHGMPCPYWEIAGIHLMGLHSRVTSHGVSCL